MQGLGYHGHLYSILVGHKVQFPCKGHPQGKREWWAATLTTYLKHCPEALSWQSRYLESRSSMEDDLDASKGKHGDETIPKYSILQYCAALAFRISTLQLFHPYNCQKMWWKKTIWKSRFWNLLRIPYQYNYVIFSFFNCLFLMEHMLSHE